MSSEAIINAAYQREVERLRAQGIVGRSGRLRELFDFLAERGPEADSASQAEIAQEVFGQLETDADDATVRVYVHRLRKKLEDHYAAKPAAPGDIQLDLPAGVYALRVVAEEAAPPAALSTPEQPITARPPNRVVMAFALLAVIAAFAAGFLLSRENAPPTNAIWDPLLESERPVLVVLGDYYLFGEIDPIYPEDGRLIRDFQVNSPEDLLRMQEADPDRYGNAEDVGLNYLPFQSAYALQSLAPLLQGSGKEVRIIAASELTSDQLNSHDVVYIGLLSAMGLLEEITFANSSVRIGDSYDDLIDKESGERWMSDEARRLASPAFYRDYAYVARFSAPGGAMVTVVASERVTGLRGVGPIVASGELDGSLRDHAGGEGFEALYQVTGQQGADLSNRLIWSRERD